MLRSNSQVCFYGVAVHYCGCGCGWFGLPLVAVAVAVAVEIFDRIPGSASDRLYRRTTGHDILRQLFTPIYMGKKETK